MLLQSIKRGLADAIGVLEDFAAGGKSLDMAKANRGCYALRVCIRQIPLDVELANAETLLEILLDGGRLDLDPGRSDSARRLAAAVRGQLRAVEAVGRLVA